MDVVVIGLRQIGQAIARRVGVGKHIVLADVRRENAEAAGDNHRQQLSDGRLGIAPRAIR